MLPHSIRALVVDDEPLARQRVQRLLARDPEIVLAGSVGSLDEARQLDASFEVELVLLDIHLPVEDGFALLDVLHQRGLHPFVIFVTAYSEHAVTAFDQDAVDYVLKPFDDDRFIRAIARAKSVIRQKRGNGAETRPAHTIRDAEASPGRQFPGRLLLSEHGRVMFLPTEIIEFAQAAGKMVKIFARGQCHTLREPLHQLEARLDPTLFVRIHRSTIVNVEQIVEMHPLFHGDCELVLKRGTRLTMSRRFRARLQPFLAGTWPA